MPEHYSPLITPPNSESAGRPGANEAMFKLEMCSTRKEATKRECDEELDGFN